MKATGQFMLNLNA